MRKRLVALTLTLALSVSLAVPAWAARAMQFTDINSNQWFYPYVADLYDKGVIDGTSAATFTPKGTVTLGQALKLILLAAGYDEQAPTTTHWASGYYHLASKRGFLGSASALTLDQPINRQQIAEIAAKATGLERTNHARSPFSDTTNLSVMALYDHGILTGIQEKGQLLFKPRDQITRAEISAIIWRMAQALNTAEPPEETTEPVTEEPATEEPATEEPFTEQPSTEQPATEEPSGKTYFTFQGKKIPVQENIPLNDLDNSLFQRNENGFLIYDSDRYSCRVGIDVSKYQGSIDWTQVKDAGVEFALLRLGYRGYGSGALVTDSYFYQNIQGALDNDIDVGVYFFSQAISGEEGAEEARYVMDALRNYSITYPIVFDWEPYDKRVGARTYGLDDTLLTDAAVSFCETVEAAGYQAMVYSNLTYFYLHFDLSRLTSYPFWLAQYNSRPSFYYHFDIWQYSGKGRVPGIRGDVDLNIQFVPK